MNRFRHSHGMVNVAGTSLLLTLMLTSSGMGQILGGLTVGVLLDRLASKVKEAEEKAIGGGMVLEIGAGGEISLAIQQAKAAYADSLNLTVSQLNSEDQNIINSLKSVVDRFGKASRENLSDLLDEARGLVHNMPLSKHFPLVYRYHPNYVVGTKATNTPPLYLELSGDFVDLPEPGYAPTLKILGKSFTAASKSSNKIIFMLPATLFAPATDHININFANIDISYTKDSIIRQMGHTEFVLPISTVPGIIGKFAITITTPTPGTITHEVTAPPDRDFVQDSSQDDIKDGGEHADLAIHRWAASSGWRIIPGSVHYRITWKQGDEGVERDWWFGRNLSTPQEAVLTFNTEHHGLGTSGKIHFKMIFTEEKDVLQDSNTVREFQMGWNESRVIVIPAGAHWTGSFTRYDGKVQEFAGPMDNGLVKVSQTGSVISFESLH